MKRRSPFVRCLTLLWASLQLAAPALSSIADGRLTLENASQPTTHVEATTSESCPVVHTPDCAVCRYLSVASVPDAAAAAVNWRYGDADALVETASTEAGTAAVGLPRGRAPPQA